MNRYILVLLLGWSFRLWSQQVADTSYHPVILQPEYQRGLGPVILIDEGHYNFHTRDGRYRPFADLLERDGYRVGSYSGKFEGRSLAEGKILVIANALHESNETNWYLPTPSAFTKEEIAAVHKWVSDGGSLFLIADHMPMAGAAQSLGATFGLEFTNGFAVDTTSYGPSHFTREDHTLRDDIMTKGRHTDEMVHEVVTFTGQAFRAPASAIPLLIFNSHHINLMPDTAWVFNDDTPVQPAEGWLQGAYFNYGKGRVAVFGEAAMFTAQLAGASSRKVGMNSPDAPDNYRLLLNIIHWLDRKW